jgi:hypothetical protein
LLTDVRESLGTLISNTEANARSINRVKVAELEWGVRCDHRDNNWEWNNNRSHPWHVVSSGACKTYDVVLASELVYQGYPMKPLIQTLVSVSTRWVSTAYFMAYYLMIVFLLGPLSCLWH